MLCRVCNALIVITRHRICCRIPEWTAHVGQPWKPLDEAPWNLYNLLWRLGQAVARHGDD